MCIRRGWGPIKVLASWVSVDIIPRTIYRKINFGTNTKGFRNGNAFIFKSKDHILILMNVLHLASQDLVAIFEICNEGKGADNGMSYSHPLIVIPSPLLAQLPT